MLLSSSRHSLVTFVCHCLSRRRTWQLTPRIIFHHINCHSNTDTCPTTLNPYAAPSQYNSTVTNPHISYANNNSLASSPSSSQLSTLTESDSESDEDSNTFEDIQDNDNDAENARQDESEEKMKSSSSVSVMSAANASDAPAETAQRRRGEKQEDGVKVKNPIATSEGGDKVRINRAKT